ncbi:MAG: DUF3341 domain-containing protein [Candidatus Latescibacteria bacterium]|nr:DUF3341 domain-containing protein [Candidatus Latescibacterota bacterium]NIM22150.1 DUF3341 domain-containing protein [Candidatus Latescibacterota bacterium]NIM64700.1 DUF3341 domain-containing protein [Candidatus Latescibacterota bacterium]NIO01210.1 DUF3341 domain-containing protein [Candidatus Latescibacterota bacterium]NIO27595.1 DUF3341 domain-containing protein [Candidatus Latescibacterota bacterium]
MSERFVFERKEEFLEKLREIVRSGVPEKRITVLSPYPVHEVDEILPSAPSGVRVFALLGAVAGLVTGFVFTIYTVKVWPLISGGKPLVSIPAFLIIAFELAILFGSLLSFIGFLHFSRLPDVNRIVSSEEFENMFEIRIEAEER